MKIYTYLSNIYETNAMTEKILCRLRTEKRRVVKAAGRCARKIIPEQEAETE